MNTTLPPNIDHGTRGRIKITSQWNTDRDIPSRQVWVEFWLRGRCLGIPSVNLVEDLGRVDLDNKPIPEGVNGYLAPEEMRFVESISEEFEGRDH